VTRDEYIAKASRLLRAASHHTGGSLRIDAYRVIEVMEELIEAVDVGDIK
jgi:hypothetical protein